MPRYKNHNISKSINLINNILVGKGIVCVLSPLPLGDLGATYDDHLTFIGKRVVDFLLVLIELFSLDVTVTAEALRRFRSNGVS